jgi:hypothetical protein
MLRIYTIASSIFSLILQSRFQQFPIGLKNNILSSMAIGELNMMKGKAIIKQAQILRISPKKP